ncbi:DUF2007 domain-containing protein [Sphingomonas sabuli]|uniref:DUF2007 domain-containing protein n=1 Tax=Sphingomonas sabuli TaxID=2764186 RepID=A0A7G9L0A9_9SPHN|nr:DUF2007 domain-containing protein [Sphingomonas sabuli]QNM82058.1 DUF2007 domain-containing protein [Sphingomonas sabuli]
MSALAMAARYNTAIEAEVARTFLESNGVEAVVFDSASSLYAEGALIGARVMVLDEDLEEAVRLLADVR